jgi:hypothetical protein
MTIANGQTVTRRRTASERVFGSASLADQEKSRSVSVVCGDGGANMNMLGANETGSSNVRWLLIFWLFVLSSVAFLDRVNMSIAGSSIADSYQLANIQLGLARRFACGGGYLARLLWA